MVALQFAPVWIASTGGWSNAIAMAAGVAIPRLHPLFADERVMGTSGAQVARKSLVEYERYYKKYLKGFEQMELVATASILNRPE
jgi:hypothetical protein